MTREELDRFRQTLATPGIGTVERFELVDDHAEALLDHIDSQDARIGSLSALELDALRRIERYRKEIAELKRQLDGQAAKCAEMRAVLAVHLDKGMCLEEYPHCGVCDWCATDDALALTPTQAEQKYTRVREALGDLIGDHDDDCDCWQHQALADDAKGDE